MYPGLFHFDNVFVEEFAICKLTPTTPRQTRQTDGGNLQSYPTRSTRQPPHATSQVCIRSYRKYIRISSNKYIDEQHADKYVHMYTEYMILSCSDMSYTMDLYGSLLSLQLTITFRSCARRCSSATDLKALGLWSSGSLQACAALVMGAARTQGSQGALVSVQRNEKYMDIYIYICIYICIYIYVCMYIYIWINICEIYWHVMEYRELSISINDSSHDMHDSMPAIPSPPFPCFLNTFFHFILLPAIAFYCPSVLTLPHFLVLCNPCQQPSACKLVWYQLQRSMAISGT